MMRSKYCTVEANYRQADRQSRSPSATAELLVTNFEMSVGV